MLKNKFDKMKILLLDKNHPLISEQLLEKNFILEEDFISSYEQVLEKIDKYEGVIIRSRIPLDARLLEKGKNLKFIGRVGAGMENIDVLKAQELGIKLINSPEGNRDAVAEHCLGMLLVLMNRLFISANEVKNNIWLREENRGEEIKGKTLIVFEWESPNRELPEELENLKVKEYDLPFPKTVEEAIVQAYGLKSLLNPNVQAEGIVWWNVERELFEELDFRPNFKAINNKYLLK